MSDSSILPLVEALTQWDATHPEDEHAIDRVEVGNEIEALQLIYEEGSLSVHEGSPPLAPGSTVQYDVIIPLPPPYESTSFRVCVSCPPTYPSTSPPRLQLLSRYIGSFGVSASLFGTITRIFMTSSPSQGVTFSPGQVVVFDGIEKVREIVGSWYEERLSEKEVLRVVHAEERGTASPAPPLATEPGTGPPSLPSGILTGPTEEEKAALAEIEIIEGEAIHDRGSTFVARVCRISNPSQVSYVVSHLRSDRKIARAAHPTIVAWRCTVNGVVHNDNDDDGESAAGSRLAHLLQILELDNVLIVVTRYFGGIHLGPDRFKHINQCARDALEQAGFLSDEKVSKKGRGQETTARKGHSNNKR